MPNHIDITGHKIGKLTVISKEKINGKYWWNCQCDCGNITKVIAGALTKKDKPTRSCGCMQKNSLPGEKSNSYKHGHAINRRGSKSYNTLNGMKSRCYNKNNKRYDRYGARGITVCERWLVFENFLKDMGEPEPSQTLDRIDNDKGYYPENCRWTTMKVQNRNRHDNLIFTKDGKTKMLLDWAEETGINYGTLRTRILYKGWDVKKALETPALKSKRYATK